MFSVKIMLFFLKKSFLKIFEQLDPGNFGKLDIYFNTSDRIHASSKHVSFFFILPFVYVEILASNMSTFSVTIFEMQSFNVLPCNISSESIKTIYFPNVASKPTFLAAAAPLFF